MTFPISAASPVQFPGPIPASCDVVIIGGGVIGVMTAWFLAEKGLRVTLCEKGRIAGEQSSRNWGWVRQQGRDPAELPIMIEAMRIWKSLAQEFGESLGFRQDGALYLAKSEAEMAGFAAWLPYAQAHGLDTHLLTKGQVTARLKGAADLWCGGLITPSDARAEPFVAVPILATGPMLRRAGATSTTRRSTAPICRCRTRRSHCRNRRAAARPAPARSCSAVTCAPTPCCSNA